MFSSNQEFLYLASTVPFYLEEEDRHRFIFFQFDPDDLKNLWHELRCFLWFGIDHASWVLLTSCLLSFSSADGSPVKWHASRHIFWKPWHPFCYVLLGDYKYTLAQPVWHALIAKGFQWLYSLQWPIYMSNALLGKCFCKNRTTTNKRPRIRLPRDTAACPSPPITPCVHIKVVTEGLSGEWIVTGQWFSEDCFPVFTSRS